MHPTIVVPELVAFGSGTPLACKAALRVWLEKSNPGMLVERARRAQVSFYWDLRVSYKLRICFRDRQIVVRLMNEGCSDFVN